MMISTRGRYALKVMIDLAKQNTDEFIPLKDIARRQEVSEKYLEAIIKSLIGEKMLLGVRGKGGGYRLTRHPSEYTVGSILSICEGGLTPVSCIEDGECTCENPENCVTLPLWQKLEVVVMDYLNSVSLEDLANGNV